MKGIKWTLIISLSALVAYGLCGTAFAFHSTTFPDGSKKPGVAECSGCHTMHNSEGGQTVRQGSGSPTYLLRAFTASDTCLTCHADYGQGAGGNGYGSGGDFSWITKTFSWTNRNGGLDYSQGDNHGHNINSNTLNIAPDATLGAAPGGTYLSNKLGCNSCHDPHAKQHNALLLYGAESVTAAGYPGDYAFTNVAPILKSPGRVTNKNGSGHSTSASVSNTRHTAFGQGMSAWCANCHGAMVSGHVHPTNVALNSTYVLNYNAYVSTDDKTSGLMTTSYREKVPFEVGTDCTTSLSTTSTAGPITSQSTVMCLSCHRSHASAYPYAGRWDFGADDVSKAHPVTGDFGASADDVLNKNYAEVLPTGQKSLCNKCHVKD